MISVVIASKNRASELRRCVDSILRFAPTAEIIVLDDGSTDETAATMNDYALPNLKYVRFDESKGATIRRNQGVQMAANESICFVDDDAAFNDASTAAAIETAFASNDDTYAIAIPYIDVNFGPEIKQTKPDGRDWLISEFRGTACAVRRSRFLELGGFQPLIIQQNEETELATKIYAAGGVIRIIDASPLLHFESPRRSMARVRFLNSRNSILHCILLVPFPYIIWHLPIVTLKGPFRIVTLADWIPAWKGTIAGIVDGFSNLNLRKPISPQAYRRFRYIRKRILVVRSELP